MDCLCSAPLAALLLLTSSCTSFAQQIDWDLTGAQQVTQSLERLPARDRLGIVHRLREKADDLHAMRVEAGAGHIFVVQGAGQEMCSPTGNCSFWLVSADYKILGRTIAQTFTVQSTSHHGRPDLITAMHGSAFDSDFIRWQFDGMRYLKAACAAAEFGNGLGDAGPVWYAQPHITPESCRSR